MANYQFYTMNKLILVLLVITFCVPTNSFGQCPPLDNGSSEQSYSAPSNGEDTFNYSYVDVGKTGEIKNASAGEIYQLRNTASSTCAERFTLYYVVREASRTGPVVGYGTLPVSFYASSNTNYFVDVYENSSCSTSGSYGCNWDVLNCSPSDNCESPLPVSLTSFDGYNKNNINHITWTTASETNNSFFLLETSIDGQVWDQIDKQKGAGTSASAHHYSFAHRDFEEGINYYRLTQHDYDGKSETFALVSIDNSSHKKITKRMNLLGQEVDETYQGIVIVYYDDQTHEKIVQ